MAPPKPKPLKPKSKVTDHPFNKPSADVILRSSDNVDFHVHKVVLSDASSVFETMFTLPEGAEGAPTADGLPVVKMQENSQVLCLLLGVLYPGKGPVITDAARAADVLAVADKYAMDGVMNHIEHVLCAVDLDCGRYIPVMNTYALARRHGFKQLAARAARASLQHNVLAYSLSGLKSMTLEHYHDLLAYRQACVDIIEDYLPSYDDEGWEDVWEACLDRVWSNDLLVVNDIPEDDLVLSNPDCCPDCTRRRLWIKLHLQRLRDAFSKRVCGASLNDPTIIDKTLTDIGDCSDCLDRAPMELIQFNRNLGQLLDSRLAAMDFWKFATK